MVHRIILPFLNLFEKLYIILLLFISSMPLEIIIKDNIRVPLGSHLDKKVIIGSDHRGFELKKEVAFFLKKQGYNFKDVGTYSAERADYPLIAAQIAMPVSQDESFLTVGIGICGSGIGMSIVANKFPHVYAALCPTAEIARNSRIHNNANFLALPADIVQNGVGIVEVWLKIEFYSHAQEHEAYLRRFVQTEKL